MRSISRRCLASADTRWSPASRASWMAVVRSRTSATWRRTATRMTLQPSGRTSGLSASVALATTRHATATATAAAGRASRKNVPKRIGLAGRTGFETKRGPGKTDGHRGDREQVVRPMARRRDRPGQRRPTAGTPRHRGTFRSAGHRGRRCVGLPGSLAPRSGRRRRRTGTRWGSSGAARPPRRPGG